MKFKGQIPIKTLTSGKERYAPQVFSKCCKDVLRVFSWYSLGVLWVFSKCPPSSVLFCCIAGFHFLQLCNVLSCIVLISDLIFYHITCLSYLLVFVVIDPGVASIALNAVQWAVSFAGNSDRRWQLWLLLKTKGKTWDENESVRFCNWERRL